MTGFSAFYDRTHFGSLIVDSLSGGIIQVIVGSDSLVTLYVHENVICASSDFFKAAMSSDWKESRERSIELRDDEPDAFQIYQHWLYCGTIPTRNGDADMKSNIEYLELAKAYVLGDKLRDGNFKDVIIDAALHKSSSVISDGAYLFPGEDVVRCIYDNTPKSCEARHFLVDFYVEHGNGLWLNEPGDFPKDFLADLAVALFERKDSQITAEPKAASKQCKYHQHRSGTCYKDRFN